jgi:hypothetical protein
MRYVGIASIGSSPIACGCAAFSPDNRCGLREVAKENYQWRKLWTDHEADGEDAASPSSSWAASATGYGFASPNGP